MRFLRVSDLVAAEAKYHSSCRTSYIRKKMAPFLYMCHKLEEGIELYTVTESHKGMEQFGDDIYSVKMTKAKLIDKYGNSIRFVNRRNRSDIILLENVR